MATHRPISNRLWLTIELVALFVALPGLCVLGLPTDSASSFGDGLARRGQLPMA
jgi:hypothetical protein